MIRPFTAHDARPVAELLVRAWRWAYSDFVDDERMPAVQEREAALGADHGLALSVWDQDGRVVGVVGTSDGELKLLYVDPPAQGAGVGSALLEHAVTALRAQDHDDAVLWVFEENGHGRAFYEGRGWRPDRGRRELWRGVFELRYRRELSCSSR